MLFTSHDNPSVPAREARTVDDTGCLPSNV